MSQFQSLPDHYFGWRDWPNQRAAVAATFAQRTFSLAAPQLMRYASDRKDTFLYRAFKDVVGSYPTYDAQTIGDCTSHGSGHTGDLTECLEIVLGDQEEFKPLATEAIYGFGREIANMLRDNGDGCYGTAVGKAMTEFGVVPREIVGAYSGKRAKEWGYSGVPAEIKKAAAEHKFAYSTLITTLAEQDAAIDNGYVTFTAGNEAFAMQRDANGVCAQDTRDSWPHLMGGAWGRITISGVVYYVYAQSWGANVPSGPTPYDLPDFCFLVHEKTHARRLAQQDTVAVAKFDGFKRRPLPSDWTHSGWIG